MWHLVGYPDRVDWGGVLDIFSRHLGCKGFALIASGAIDKVAEKMRHAVPDCFLWGWGWRRNVDTVVVVMAAAMISSTL